jgi:hypothetical protein
MSSTKYYLKIFVAVIGLINIAQCRRYHAHDHVGIVANTVGPFNNPTETYPVRSLIICFKSKIITVVSQFYSLPFCSGTGRQRRHKQDLGETLSGSRKVATPYDLTFLDPVPWRSLCEEYLDAKDVSLSLRAILFVSFNFTQFYRLRSLKMQLKVIFSSRCSSMICQCGATSARLEFGICSFLVV